MKLSDLINQIKGIIADTFVYWAFCLYSDDKNKLELAAIISKWNNRKDISNANS